MQDSMAEGAEAEGTTITRATMLKEARVQDQINRANDNDANACVVLYNAEVVAKKSNPLVGNEAGVLKMPFTDMMQCELTFFVEDLRIKYKNMAELYKKMATEELKVMAATIRSMSDTELAMLVPHISSEKLASLNADNLLSDKDKKRLLDVPSKIQPLQGTLTWEAEYFLAADCKQDLKLYRPDMPNTELDNEYDCSKVNLVSTDAQPACAMKALVEVPNVKKISKSANCAFTDYSLLQIIGYYKTTTEFQHSPKKEPFVVVTFEITHELSEAIDKGEQITPADVNRIIKKQCAYAFGGSMCCKWDANLKQAANNTSQIAKPPENDEDKAKESDNGEKKEAKKRKTEFDFWNFDFEDVPDAEGDPETIWGSGETTTDMPQGNMSKFNVACKVQPSGHTVWTVWQHSSTREPSEIMFKSLDAELPLASHVMLRKAPSLEHVEEIVQKCDPTGNTWKCAHVMHSGNVLMNSAKKKVEELGGQLKDAANNALHQAIGHLPKAAQGIAKKEKKKEKEEKKRQQKRAEAAGMPAGVKEQDNVKEDEISGANAEYPSQQNDSQNWLQEQPADGSQSKFEEADHSGPVFPQLDAEFPEGTGLNHIHYRITDNLNRRERAALQQVNFEADWLGGWRSRGFSEVLDAVDRMLESDKCRIIPVEQIAAFKQYYVCLRDRCYNLLLTLKKCKIREFFIPNCSECTAQQLFHMMQDITQLRNHSLPSQKYTLPPSITSDVNLSMWGGMAEQRLQPNPAEPLDSSDKEAIKHQVMKTFELLENRCQGVEPAKVWDQDLLAVRQQRLDAVNASHA